MKRLALCGTAALLTLAAATRPAAASGYYISWAKTAPTPTAQPAEKAASGYYISWAKGQTAE